MRTAVILLASAGYVGYIPIASGTWGSLVGIPFFWVFAHLGPIATVVLFAAAVWGACWVAGKAEGYFAEHDSSKIVIDEVAGYIAATLFLPFTMKTVVLAFLIFRVLDIVKHFPAGYIDANLPGGYGVTLDDVVSGLYSNLLVRLVLIFWPG